MGVNINCRQNDQGAWCRDRRVKRSLFGIGARVCRIFEGQLCEYQDMYPRPHIAPLGQKPNKDYSNSPNLVCWSCGCQMTRLKTMVESIRDTKGRSLLDIKKAGDKDLWIFHRYIDMLDDEKEIVRHMHKFVRSQNKAALADGEKLESEIVNIEDFLNFKDEHTLCG